LFAAGTGNLIGSDADGTNDAAERNVISGNRGNGVWILQGTSGTTVAGNYIGTDVTGTAAVPNVLVAGGGGALGPSSPNNVIGGTAVASRNIISGNAERGVIVEGAGSTGTVIEGNFIGTNAAGSAALANVGAGVQLQGGATGVTIGGTPTGAGNLI